MVAITASLAMSSQVGATAVRTRSAASANSSASRIQGREPDPNLPSFHLAGGSSDHYDNDGGKCLEGAEGDNENGACLNDERDVARNLAELLMRSPQHPL
jgi:hypothetical protein